MENHTVDKGSFVEEDYTNPEPTEPPFIGGSIFSKIKTTLNFNRAYRKKTTSIARLKAEG